MDRSKYKLTEEQKQKISDGTLKASKRKHHSSSIIFLDRLIEEFQNRSKAQRGCKKPRKKKLKDIPIKDEIVYPKNERPIPDENVKQYLQHIQNLKPNSYSRKVNKVLKLILDDEDRAIIESLDPVPLYSLRYSNRIFCKGRWQTLKNSSNPASKSLRNLLFDGCANADFRSLHFEIFQMLIKKHAPKMHKELNDLIGNRSVWEYLQDTTSQILDKSVYKLAVQALINGSSKSRTRNRLFIDIEELNQLGIDEETSDRALDFLKNSSLNQFIEIVYKGVKFIQETIKRGEIQDAFGCRLNPTSIQEYRELTGEWLPKKDKWKLIRKDLNRLYSSFELKIIADTITPCIGKYEFRVDLHLHDGFIFSVNKKCWNQVNETIQENSRRILEALEIKSELIIKEIV